MKCRVRNCEGKALGDGTNVCLKHYIQYVPKRYQAVKIGYSKMAKVNRKRCK